MTLYDRKSQRHLIEIALALQIANEDSTVLDQMVSLADPSIPQVDFISIANHLYLHSINLF